MLIETPIFRDMHAWRLETGKVAFSFSTMHSVQKMVYSYQYSEQCCLIIVEQGHANAADIRKKEKLSYCSALQLQECPFALKCMSGQRARPSRSPSGSTGGGAKQEIPVLTDFFQAKSTSTETSKASSLLSPKHPRIRADPCVLANSKRARP